MEYVSLHPSHYLDIWKLFNKVEGNLQQMQLPEFWKEMENRIGWVLFDENRPIGCVSLSNYCPNSDIVIHATIYPEYHGKWINRKLLKEIANKIFIELKLPRATSYSVPGITDKVGKLLEHIGFVYEGKKRNVMQANGKYFDHIIYGMLKKECRWL